jgi:ABC-type uncharacterized transport system permease subunit
MSEPVEAHMSTVKLALGTSAATALAVAALAGCASGTTTAPDMRRLWRGLHVWL